MTRAPERSGLPLVGTIRAALRALRDPERARGAAAYMKVALPFLGVPMPAVRKLARGALAEHPIGSEAEYRAVLELLFFEASFQEERYAALAIAGHPRCGAFQRARLLPLYRRMIVAAAWWDLVDDLSCRVGDALVRDPASVEKTLRRWSRDPNLWLRRTAIICQRKLRQDTRLPLLYACIEPSLASREFFLRKAIGWALRSLGWHDPGEVLRYVGEHASVLSPLSRREALKNLSPERASPG